MKHSSRKITDVLALGVFTVFALCVLLVLLAAAGVYRGQVRGARERFARRTAVRYITTRVRQGEGLTVEDFGGCPALVFREESGGEAYLTRVYCQGGYLRELYAPEGAALCPEDGEPVVRAETMEPYLEDGLLKVELEGQLLLLHLGAGKEEKP